MINITKKEFVKLAKENLIVLEDFQLNEAGFHDTNIYGVEQLYEAIKTYKPKP